MRRWLVLALLPAILGAVGLGGVARGESGGSFQTAWEESFERGTPAPELQMIHEAGPHNVQVVDLKSPAAPPVLLERDRANSCGRYALRFETPPGSSRLTVAMARPFKRHLQGPNDRVVFQADLFLPQKLTGSAALIGIAPSDPTGKHPWKMFRFGYAEGKVFFAFANGEPSPFLYVEDTVLFESLEREAWHRLQMEFTGTGTIRCSVDGVAAAFSPISQTLVNELEPGLLIVSGRQQPGAIFADNLGVVWKQGGTDTPASPWQPDLARRVAATPMRGEGIEWVSSVDDARRQAAGDGRTVALMFSSSDVGAIETLDKIIRFDPSCKDVLSRFVPCRLDISAEPGKSLAQQLGIFRVPCIVMFNSEGRELDRIVYDRETSWPDLMKQLTASRN